MGFLSPTIKSKVSVGETGEFAATSSEYGKDIQRVYGTDRLDGNLIWWSDIRLIKSTSTQTSGGKGGAKQKTTTTTFEYFVDLDIAFAQGPAIDVLRIWFDGKLGYDKQNGSVLSDLTFRFYPGDETQLPDPLVEAAVGENLASANRGICHIVFENLNLADFGNRIPSITAEIAFSGDGDATNNSEYLGNAVPNVVVDTLEDYTSVPINDTGGAFNDLQRKLFIYSTGSDSSEEANIIIDLDTLELSAVPAQDTSDVFGGNGFIRAVHEVSNDVMNTALPNTGSSRNDLWIRDDVTGATVFFADDSRISRGDIIDFNGAPYVVGINTSSGDLTDTGYRVLDIPANTLRATLAKPSGFAMLRARKGRAAAQLGVGAAAEAFGVFTSSNQIRIVQFVVTPTGTVSASVIAFIAPGDVVPGATSWNFNPAYGVDRSNGNLYFHHTIDGTPYVWAFSTNLNAVSADPIVWVTQVPLVKVGTTGVQNPAGSLIGSTNVGTIGQLSLYGGHWVWVGDDDSTVYAISLATGNLVPSYEGTEEYPGIGQGWEPAIAQTYFHWHDQTSTLIGVVDNPSSTPAEGIYATRFTFNVAVEMNPRETVRQMCLDAGLEESDIDVTALPVIYPGVRSFKRAERGKMNDSISNIIDLIAFNVSEIDGKIKFVEKGQVATETIPEDDLVRNGSTEGEVFVKASTRERDLPRVFEVNYNDSDNAYQSNVQRDQRPGNPVSSVSSDSVDNFEYSGSGSANAFQAAATRELYSAWAEVDKLTFRLPPRYLGVTATDTIVLETSEVIYTGRARIADIGADFTVDVEQVVEIDGQYTVVGVGSGGSSFQREIPNTGPTTSYLMNLPLLNDVDDAGQSTSILYWAAAGEPVWPGAQLYKKTGSSVITQLATETADVAAGITLTALPDATRTTRFEDDDVTFTISVLFGEDQFESTTVENILAGANALAVIKSNGEVEVLQFKTATFINDVTVQLSGLLRGRRGTEPYTTGHATGEQVVLLSTLTASVISNAATDVGTPQTYIAPTIGQLFESALEIAFTPRGEDLKPYSPVHVRLTNPGTPDGVDISWVRRTRIGGELTDLVDVPLSETSENYEVEILDAPGGTVLRTLTSATQSVNYSAANITTDFGSLPATLDVVVYQLSAAVGRGKPAIASLET